MGDIAFKSWTKFNDVASVEKPKERRAFANAQLEHVKSMMEANKKTTAKLMAFIY